jgi:hypothetical protein
MAIPTSSITMTGIATELGISTSNISLDSLGDKMIVIDPGSSRQTFTLTDTITLTTDDTSVAANMNTGSGSTQMSEFGGYTKADPIQFSSTNSAVSEQVETVNVYHSLSIPGCPVLIRLSSEIYAKRVSNDLVWYVGEGFYSNFGQHYKEGTQIGTDTEVARLAGVAANTSTTVSVSYSMVTQNPGFSDVTLSAVSTGSTSNNLVSSNTKCGFDFRLFGQSENNNSQQNVVYTMLVKYTVTHPNHVPRVFGFFVGLKGRYTGNNSGGPFEC